MVAGTAGWDVGSLFDGLLEPELIDAYERLRALDGCPKDQASGLVGAGLVEALLHWGMAHVRPPTPPTRRGCSPPPLTWPCRPCSPGASTGSPATSNACSTGSGACPMPRPGSAAA